jgi:lysophospholipase L1-like esterase
MLLLIGTNDANPDTDPDLFKGYVTSIATAALTDGVDRVYIATIPPLYTSSGDPETVLNNRIVQFNIRILQIADDDLNDAILRGPDFYTLFDGQYSVFYDPDGTHPNDAGYQAMAAAWQTTLSSTP